MEQLSKYNSFVCKNSFLGGSGFRESFAIVIAKTHCYLSQRYRYDTD